MNAKERKKFEDKINTADFHRKFLNVHGFITEKENGNIKKRIEKELKREGYVSKSKMFCR